MTHTSPAVTRPGRIVKSALVESTEVLKVVRTAVVKTGCLWVSRRDRCAKQVPSEKILSCQGIYNLGLLLSVIQYKNAWKLLVQIPLSV